MNRWLLWLALVSLPGMAADVVIKPSAPSSTRSGYDRSVSLNAQVTTLTLGDAVYLGLPDEDGLKLLQQLRQQGLELPVLILTARDSVTYSCKAS